jgi:hypothetical protein
VTPDDNASGSGLSISASISAGFDDLRRDLQERWKRLEDAYTSSIPRDVPITASGTTSSTGTVLIGCKGPQQGSQWTVRSILVAGPTTGKIYFYAAASRPILTPLQYLEMRDCTSTRWPAPSFYGDHQFVINPRENLYVLVTTATHTTGVVVNGVAESYDLSVGRHRYSL